MSHQIGIESSHSTSFFPFFLFFFFFFSSFRSSGIKSKQIGIESSHNKLGSNQDTALISEIRSQDFFFFFSCFISKSINDSLEAREYVGGWSLLCANPQEVREGTSAVGQASSPNSRLPSQVLTAPWSHSTRFELASRLSPVWWMTKVPASTQLAGTSPRRNPASLHYPLPLIVLTAPWSHSTRFELASRISTVQWMAKVPASTQQAGPSPRRNPASSHYPLPCPWATP